MVSKLTYPDLFLWPELRLVNHCNVLRSVIIVFEEVRFVLDRNNIANDVPSGKRLRNGKIHHFQRVNQL